MTSQSEWDAFAATYAQVQCESRLPIEHDVVTYLTAQLPLTTMTAVDLAAGTGRYALPLSRVCQTVELIDWAPAMLKYADQWLADHHRANYTLTVADWRQLPAVPRADLVFVSQLPDLRPADLPQLLAMTNQALVLNLQTLAASSLLTQMAAALHLPVPVQPQADPQRLAALLQALETHHIAYRHHRLTYRLKDEASVSDLLPDFDRPFSVSEANQLAVQTAGVPQANQLVPVVLDYAFEQLIIPAKAADHFPNR